MHNRLIMLAADQSSAWLAQKRAVPRAAPTDSRGVTVCGRRNADLERPRAP